MSSVELHQQVHQRSNKKTYHLRSGTVNGPGRLQWGILGLEDITAVGGGTDRMRIVEDLIPSILDDVWASGSQRDLANCCLVSAAWLLPSRRRLYTRPILWTPLACTALANTIRENSQLRSFVCGIAMHAISSSDENPFLIFSPDNPNQLHWHNARSLLHIRGLREVTLGGFLAIYATWQIISLYSERLISLHIDGSTLRRVHGLEPPLDWDRQMAAKLSGLSRLELHWVRLVIAHPTTPYALQLTDIILDNVIVFPGDLSHLCYGCWDTVRRIRISGYTDLDTDEQLRQVLGWCTNLESFHYVVRGGLDHGAIYDEKLIPLPSLRRLHLVNVQLQQGSLQAIARAFVNLEELVLEGERTQSVTPDMIHDLLRSRSLPALKRVSVPDVDMATKLHHSPSSASMSNSYHSTHRKPSKKSSFLSLRKEKKSADAALGQRPTTSGHSPSSYQHFDYDDIPSDSPSVSRPYPLSGSRSRSGSKTGHGSQHGGLSRVGTGRRSKRDDLDRAEADIFDFPTVDDASLSSATEDTNPTWHRPSTTRDSEQTFLTRSVNYPFRDSGSSSLSQFDPYPQTPIDDLSFRGSIFSIPVMVAAPVAGVETMDALVDGMNGYAADDHFMGSGGLSSRIPKISKSGHHPLYHPPLPTPPPGIKLGGPLPRKASRHQDSSSDDEVHHSKHSKHPQRYKTHRPGSSRAASTITVTKSTLQTGPSKDDLSVYSGHSGSSIYDDDAKPLATPTQAKAVAPSISEIIRAHAPPSQQARSKPGLSRKTSSLHSNGRVSTVESIPYEPIAVMPDPLPTDEEGDLTTRSSVDTIAEEIRQTIRNQARTSIIAPVSRPSTGYSYMSAVPHPSPVNDARTLSSPRHILAYQTCQFTVSGYCTIPPLESFDYDSEVHSRPSCFTGSASYCLGCVRQIMGLYDEMAECLGIRLITIDSLRWGLGRTDTPRAKSARGIPEWAGVVEEILDQLHIDQCSIMAHSAGAPYALAFANKFPERIRGDICLLAPWVGGGEGAGYKWLKYVPNGILKTAQAAEWKVQAWMLGKPPTLAYEGIGFDVKTSRPSTATSTPSRPSDTSVSRNLVSSPSESEPRPSMGSGVFSDYDDLRDFDGRFESRSTLGRRSSCSTRSRTVSETKRATASRKPSKGFLGRLKSGMSPSIPQSPEEKPNSGKRLKALRSMGSLKGKSSSNSRKTSTPPLSLPSPEIGLGLDDVDWSDTVRIKSSSTPPTKPFSARSSIAVSEIGTPISNPRAGGRRSVSFGPTRSPPPPPPPVPPLPPSPMTMTETNPNPAASYQAALGNALIAASHAESAKGTHSDLLQILNHDRQPWGFSYAAYPHNVRVWYGDRDDRIAENVVRWLENTMGPDKCSVKVVKGADHALMFKSQVVIEVMEYFSECWGTGANSSLRNRVLV
ncbi:hypothetical protein K474DRAFT_1671314 [Panus rudis PR-1116 ss-1]|nr:hypothetical protein K474DRAFT_1671314 [Panus rudis PR-1116 ss-1]